MECLNFNGVVLEETSLIHDSTNKEYRNPTGAVKFGTEVTLALKVSGLSVDGMTLCVLRGDAPVERFDMKKDSGDNNGDGSFYVCVQTQKESSPLSCVLWYWFEVRLCGGALCYYGADPPYTSGLGRVYRNPPPAYQLTVYDAGFLTPDWVKTAVMYQIFPDRFCMGDPEGVRAGIEYHRGKGRKEFELIPNWKDLPVFEAKAGQSYYMPGDIFGGDLEGIRKKLPYLKDLGVTVLYLNPIFEAASNHRYNTGDYLKIDPILGDAAVFRSLAKEAKDMGIRLVLDGVFSHTGDDSIYFNKYGRYDDTGAYQSKDSPFYSWYRFNNYPDDYVSWWGFETLPEVDESAQSWQDFIITDSDSVVKHWLGEGASGYRLDVADELPDGIIEKIRTAVKETDPEAFLLGEVWEDATTKQFHGQPRTYALGRGLDAVMNYPFQNRTIEYLSNKIDAYLYSRFLMHQLHTYPAPMYFTLMNLVSSHDISRVRTRVSSDVEPAGMSREEQAVFELSEVEYLFGGLRQRLASAIQFSLPGVPSIYYGDEVGMTGLLDPFNRRAFLEEDPNIFEWYKALAGLRTERPVLSTGRVRFFSTDGSVLGILRHAMDGRDFFGKDMEADAVLTVVNPTIEPRRIVFELDVLRGAGPSGVASPDKAVSLLTGIEAPLMSGLVEINILPLSAEIFGFE